MSGAGTPAGVYTVRAEGRGRAELPAYGMADAEHQVEKEILRAWPDARAEVLEVVRAEGAGRIVEEFRVAYRVSAVVSVDTYAPDEARREALRRLRAAFEGTRYRRIEWAKVEVTPPYRPLTRRRAPPSPARGEGFSFPQFRRAPLPTRGGGAGGGGRRSAVPLNSCSEGDTGAVSGGSLRGGETAGC